MALAQREDCHVLVMLACWNEKQLTGIVDITTPQTKAHSKAGFYGLVYFLYEFSSENHEYTHIINLTESWFS